MPNLIKISFKEPQKEPNTNFLDIVKHLQNNPPKFKKGQTVRQVTKGYQLLEKSHLHSLGLPTEAQIFVQNIERGTKDMIIGFRFEQSELIPFKYRYYLALDNVWVDEALLEADREPLC